MQQQTSTNVYPRISVVIGILNQFEITRQTIKYLLESAERPEEIQFIFLDNGSKEDFHNFISQDEELNTLLSRGMRSFVREESNNGAYPYIFQKGMKKAYAPIVAFFHSDLFVYQKGWDVSIINHFEANPNLGLLGFIGSTQMDNHGGRGLGTHSNMQGLETNSPTHNWKGSRGSIHGKQDAGFIIDGAVVDGCSMIFRKTTLEQIGFKDNYPIHHFYDRMMSLQVLEIGQKVGILGIEFDHISGQTANQEQDYQESAKKWFKEKLGLDTPQQWAELRKDWVYGVNKNNPSHGKVPEQYDHATYLEAEYLFLTEYRDSKHIIPVNC